MARNRYKQKKRGRRVIYGKTLERCCHCRELKYINHTKCAWCHQSLCYSYAFGVIWQDCEYGILQRRNRETGEVLTFYFKPHSCSPKRVAHFVPEVIWFL